MKGKTNGIEIANNIRAERNRANITIAEVSKAIGISQPTYVKYEKNAEKITVDIIIKLSKLFNCSIQSFFV